MIKNDIDKILANIKPWHPLTEIPNPKENTPGKDTKTSTNESQPSESSTKNNQLMSLHLQGLGPEVKKLLWDVITYPYSSTSVRIKRLTLSGRAFEKAKHQVLEKGLLIESSAGSTNYLIAPETPLVKKKFRVLTI